MFEQIHEKIQDFIKQERTDFYIIEDKNEKLPVSDSIFCAEDKIRNKYFWDGINFAIQKLKYQFGKNKKIIFVDAGSGTGILGIFALLLGADFCYFIETNKNSIELNRKFLNNLGLLNRAKLINKDASLFGDFEHDLDVVVSETISSGFVSEDFIKIIKNLKKHSNKDTIFMPSGFYITINELNQNMMIIESQIHEINTTEIEKKYIIKLKNKNTKFIKFCTKANLLDHIIIPNGVCPSFLNDRIFDLSKKHLFFEIII